MTAYEDTIRDELASREQEEWKEYLADHTDRLVEAQEQAVDAVDELFYGVLESIPGATEEDVDDAIQQDQDLQVAYTMMKNLIAGQFTRQSLQERAAEEYQVTPEEKRQELALQLGADPSDLDTDLTAMYEKANEEVEQLVEIAEEEGIEEATSEETILDVRRDVYGSPEELRAVYESQKEASAQLFRDLGAAMASRQALGSSLSEPGDAGSEAIASSVEDFAKKYLASQETIVEPRIEQEIEKLYGKG